MAALALVAVFSTTNVHAVDSQPLILAQADQSSSPSGSNTALEQQLDSAVAARRAKAFEQAREILTAAEDEVSPSHPLYRAIQDELHFNLPLAIAQQAMNNAEVDLAEAKINEAARYLKDHPERRKLSGTLERYRRALWMLK